MKFFAKTVGAEEYEDCEAFVVYFNQCTDAEFETNPEGGYQSLMLQIGLQPQPAEPYSLLIGDECLTGSVQRCSLENNMLQIELNAGVAVQLGFDQIEVQFETLSQATMDDLENGLYRVFHGQLSADHSQSVLSWRQII